ncbi:hypothetical protein FRB99_006744 [Tulasnella sp. 403]|nr:hypothetical protein FRB99_006744 [Tulasnella sp. 403]
MTPVQAHNYSRQFLLPAYRFGTTTNIYQFVAILASANSKNASWFAEDGQTFLNVMGDPDRNGIHRISDILCWPNVSHAAGLSETVLSFQRGYIPLLAYLVSEYVIKSTLHHVVNALYGLLDTNFDKVESTITTCLSASMALGSFNELQSETCSGFYVFRTVISCLYGYAIRFKQAVASHPNFAPLVRNLSQYLSNWSQMVLSTSSGAGQDPFFQHSTEAQRRFVLGRISKDMASLQALVDRAEGVTKRRTQKVQARNAEIAEQGLIAVLKNYEGRGILRDEGPRHNNDHAEISSIEIVPTQQELRSHSYPFLPANIPGVPHHLPSDEGAKTAQARRLPQGRQPEEDTWMDTSHQPGQILQSAGPQANDAPRKRTWDRTISQPEITTSGVSSFPGRPLTKRCLAPKQPMSTPADVPNDKEAEIKRLNEEFRSLFAAPVQEEKSAAVRYLPTFSTLQSDRFTPPPILERHCHCTLLRTSWAAGSPWAYVGVYNNHEPTQVHASHLKAALKHIEVIQTVEDFDANEYSIHVMTDNKRWPAPILIVLCNDSNALGRLVLLRGFSYNAENRDHTFFIQGPDSWGNRVVLDITNAPRNRNHVLEGIARHLDDVIEWKINDDTQRVPSFFRIAQITTQSQPSGKPQGKPQSDPQDDPTPAGAQDKTTSGKWRVSFHAKIPDPMKWKAPRSASMHNTRGNVTISLPQLCQACISLSHSSRECTWWNEPGVLPTAKRPWTHIPTKWHKVTHFPPLGQTKGKGKESKLIVEASDHEDDHHDDHLEDT